MTDPITTALGELDHILDQLSQLVPARNREAHEYLDRAQGLRRALVQMIGETVAVDGPGRADP